MADVVLQVKQLYKQYRLGLVGSGTLRDDFARFWAKLRGKEDPTLKVGATNQLDTQSDGYVWALQDINLEVKQGDVVGIIGKNGAGKSTLLKLLSRVTSPTKGEIKVKGRVASLLEVGTGFHPELTGRENIFLNGAILGMTKQEIRAKLDEIVVFAGVEKYIDTPVKRYSSGMRVRLGFAVAAHLEPEILIVDEVLAVGDAEFQKKAIGKMQEVSQGQGRTVLFVSHNMASIRNLCERVVVLKDGQKVFEGDTEQGIHTYQKFNTMESKSSKIVFPVDPSKAAQFLSVFTCDKQAQHKDTFEFSDTIFLKINFEIHQKMQDGYILFIIEDLKGNKLFASANDDQSDSVIGKLDENEHSFIAKIPEKILAPGTYYVTLSLKPKIGKPHHKIENALSFEVIDTKTYRGMKNLYRPLSIAPEIDWRLILD